MLRRSTGIWQIVHEHSYYPMEMDGSGRAATKSVAVARDYSPQKRSYKCFAITGGRNQRRDIRLAISPGFTVRTGLAFSACPISLN